MFARVVFIKVNFLFEISFEYDVQCKNAYIFNIYAPSTWMDSFFLFRMLSFTISKNIYVCIELFNKWKCRTWDIVQSPTSWTDITLKNLPKKKMLSFAYEIGLRYWFIFIFDSVLSLLCVFREDLWKWQAHFFIYRRWMNNNVTRAESFFGNNWLNIERLWNKSLCSSKVSFLWK